MEMHQVRYFLAVCESLNFTRAAEHCGVSQPSLTRAVQKLEDELGGPLFRRERHLTHLTDLGRLIRPELEQIWQHSETARRAARSFLTLEDAPLQLGVMSSIGPLRSVDFIAAFARRHPGIEVRLREAPPAELDRRLRAGELDLVLTARPGRGDARCNVEPLYRERYVVAFPPDHRFAALRAVRLGDLDGETCLVRSDCEHWEHVRTLCRQARVELRSACRSRREDWIQTMVLAGVGVVLLPEYSVVMAGLATRALIAPGLTREVALVTLAGRRFLPAVATFMRAIRAWPWRRPPPHDTPAREDQ
jgi:LysR family transcriptional regulator, hydrogen peroxide-inducible genes activator